MTTPRAVPGVLLAFSLMACNSSTGSVASKTGDDASHASGGNGATGGSGQTDSALGRGLFVTEATLERARARASGSDPLFQTQSNLLQGRADEAMSSEFQPFYMADVRAIRFGWCEDADYAVFDTLKDATVKFETDSDQIRSLGLEYAISLDEAYADRALEVMLAYAQGQTIVNLHDLDVDYDAATLRGEPNNNDYCSDMPWNFALDAMWQAYGLINVADTYLLLTRNGYGLSNADDAAIRDWILQLTEAVNSSFHAWTKWADLHPASSSLSYYRSDNHLSWSMAGLIAGAAALGDEELCNYVVRGGSWTDRRSGAYQNPSYQLEVIDRSIDGQGVIFEETVPRDPPIGYSFFHLWAMVLVAEIAELHCDDPEVWQYQSPDGGSLKKAFDRYAAYILGTAQSDHPDEPDFGSLYGWLYEPAVDHWHAAEHESVLREIDRNNWTRQSVGPTALLLGSEP